jgi:hypothetical protein
VTHNSSKREALEGEPELQTGRAGVCPHETSELDHSSGIELPGVGSRTTRRPQGGCDSLSRLWLYSTGGRQPGGREGQVGGFHPLRPGGIRVGYSGFDLVAGAVEVRDIESMVGIKGYGMGHTTRAVGRLWRGHQRNRRGGRSALKEHQSWTIHLE